MVSSGNGESEGPGEGGEHHGAREPRSELKFLVAEETAQAMRDYLRHYLALDRHSAARPTFSYPIHTLYLDTEDLQLYRQTLDDHEQRFKMRLRWYDLEPSSPVYFEIKRRVSRGVLKERCAARRAAAPGILAGRWPSPADVAGGGASDFICLERFSDLVRRLRVCPKAQVSYLREAWQNGGDESVRVTLDREVLCAASAPPDPAWPVETFAPFGFRVILELKYVGEFPPWFGGLITTFRLAQSAAGKYGTAVKLMGEQRYFCTLAARNPLAGTPEGWSFTGLKAGFSGGAPARAEAVGDAQAAAEPQRPAAL